MLGITGENAASGEEGSLFARPRLRFQVGTSAILSEVYVWRWPLVRTTPTLCFYQFNGELGSGRALVSGVWMAELSSKGPGNT